MSDCPECNMQSSPNFQEILSPIWNLSDDEYSYCNMWGNNWFDCISKPIDYLHTFSLQRRIEISLYQLRSALAVDEWKEFE